MEYMLQTKNLRKSYGKYHVLNGLDMNVPRGSIYGLIGRNGAGKTTLFRVVTGLQRADTGSYIIGGCEDSKKRESYRIGAVVESPALYREMTAVENLKMQYRILGLKDFADIPELLDLVGLNDTGKKKVKHFSLGMRQRLGIAVALAGKPSLLFLDEPINGLDPRGIIEIRKLIVRLNQEQGITMVISSHILAELVKVATHFGIIDDGKMIKEMTLDELMAEMGHEDLESYYIRLLGDR